MKESIERQILFVFTALLFLILEASAVGLVIVAETSVLRVVAAIIVIATPILFAKTQTF